MLIRKRPNALQRVAAHYPRVKKTGLLSYVLFTTRVVMQLILSFWTKAMDVWDSIKSFTTQHPSHYRRPEHQVTWDRKALTEMTIFLFGYWINSSKIVFYELIFIYLMIGNERRFLWNVPLKCSFKGFLFINECFWGIIFFYSILHVKFIYMFLYDKFVLCLFLDRKTSLFIYSFSLSEMLKESIFAI